jgi:hypothetical protein
MRAQADVNFKKGHHGRANRVEASLSLDVACMPVDTTKHKTNRFTVTRTHTSTMAITTNINAHLAVPVTLPHSARITSTDEHIPDGTSSDLAITNRPYRELLVMVLNEALAMMAADIFNDNEATPRPPHLDHPTINTNECGAVNGSVHLSSKPHNDNEQGRG